MPAVAPDATTTLRLAKLSKNAPTEFHIVANPDQLATLIADLDLLDLRKVRFEGKLVAIGRQDWELGGMLGATVVQPCSVTLAPVTTRIDTPVRRLYTADFQAPTDAEAEMPEDDALEPVPEEIDLLSLLSEELALALPDFPRAEGVDPVDKTFTEPGVAPMTDEDTKPFAGLADLKKNLES